jgi:hypothetical protein
MAHKALNSGHYWLFFFLLFWGDEVGGKDGVASGGCSESPGSHVGGDQSPPP